MYQQPEKMCVENKVKLLKAEFVSNIFSCVLFARLKSFYHSKCKSKICRRSSVILWSTLMPLILNEWESMTGLLCWVCSFYLFPLMSGEKEKEKGRETDKQKDEKRERAWRYWQRHHIKRIKRICYQGKMDEWICFMQKTANSRCIEILLREEKLIINAFFHFPQWFRLFSCLHQWVYKWFRSVIMIYMWSWDMLVYKNKNNHFTDWHIF